MTMISTNETADDQHQALLGLLHLLEFTAPDGTIKRALTRIGLIDFWASATVLARSRSRTPNLTAISRLPCSRVIVEAPGRRIVCIAIRQAMVVERRTRSPRPTPRHAADVVHVPLNLLPVTLGMSRLVPYIAKPVLAPLTGFGRDRWKPRRRNRCS